MKRLTVNETWEQCLAMWKWISRQCKVKSYRESIYDYKEAWSTKNGYKEGDIRELCFFCHKGQLRLAATKLPKREWLTKYATSQCPYCPAMDIDSDFDCFNSEYHFELKPRLFYAELKRLNKIRLAKKK